MKLSDGTKLTTLNDLLGFTMPKQDGSAGTEQIDVTMADTTLTIPTGMTYSEVITLVTANGTATAIPANLQDDDDGDTGSPLGTLTATWYNNVEVVTDLSQPIDDCEGPYRLTIKATGVEANTTFGDPKIKNYGSSSLITYNFAPKATKLCYVRPLSTHSNPEACGSIVTGSPTDKCKWGGGYNPDKWGKFSRGFYVDAGFPTTGFVGAKFTLVGTTGYSLSSYRCTSTSGDVSLSTYGGNSKNCTATFTSRPTSNVVINMEYSADGYSNWVPIGSYTITASQITKWAKSSGGARGFANNNSLVYATSFPGLSACSGQTVNSTSHSVYINQQNYIYYANEITNAPPPYTGYFSRDVDGTFMGEWGNLWHYSSLAWNNATWVVGLHSPSTQKFVNTGNTGNVGSSFFMDTNLFSTCRG